MNALRESASARVEDMNMSQHDKFELAVPVSAADNALGPAQARVTLVEYGDFECPNCKQAAPVVKLLLARFGAGVRLVYRHFPLEVHPHAVHAALAAEAAGGQGRFWAMHDLLFDNQQHLELGHLRGYAEQLRLDLARFDRDMDDPSPLQRVRQQIDGGKRSGVRATPTFYINGVIRDTSFGLQSLADGVEAALRD